ncbi:adenylate isopentenyltransferase 3, chloroplastic-like [Benincasa hispida]|uniref:adenylate isopentenyltransferase 3, chloroplastic-like n=1 Tax=Benincasa hispida TaxID=102211 RepID=UPI0019012F34|nr:adenylate isopentenyltransferase 3, chloroplastic-like [Benincasa hispida]XP_038887423.1 adenylate isopentenyltransferase 3, chloroplastic-like [Benincasa hispida]
MIMGMRIPALMSKQGIRSNLGMINQDYVQVLNPRRVGDDNPVKGKEKVVVVMGATGSGKSKLSIDLATHFPNSEIINSDKMQLYQGLDVVTNKISPQDQRGIPHHLLGIATTPHLDVTVSKFCHMATLAADSIVRRRRIPIIVGGSNSYIEALLDDYSTFHSKYECCLLWVDVAMPLLHSFVSDRVDKMVASGLVEEVQELFDPNNGDYSRGIRKAIGVHELDRYFRACTNSKVLRNKLLQEGIAEIKENSCKLACRQLKKILRLQNVKGWNIHRVDATEVFRKKKSKLEAEEAWAKHVIGPSVMIVAHFLSTKTHIQDRPIILKPTSLFRMSLAATVAP